MEFEQAVRKRRTVRAFTAEPVDPVVLARLLDLARRHPKAGNTEGTAFLVLDQPDLVARYWDLTTDPAWDRDAAWPRLRHAPVVILPLASEAAYLARYAAADKIALGRDVAEGWGIPYWYVDTAFATMTLLLAATDAGLGAFFHGLFHHEPAVVDGFSVPAGWRPIGAVAIGHPAPDRPSRSVTPRDGDAANSH